MRVPEDLPVGESASDDKICRLVEELSALRIRGETLDIDGLARRFGVSTDVVRDGLAGLEGVGQAVEMVPETSASWVPPSLPEQFELRREIGRGGMGVVYEALQKDLDRVVAVKMLLPGQLAFGEAIHRFRKEARSLAKLRHPHIVSLHEVGETDGAVYYTMEYIEGRSLAEVIRSGEMTPARAVHLLKQVTSAIAYAHSQGVVHRDLKPANILVGQNGDAYVVDFGLARDTAALKGDRTQTGLILGTPAYMSPEQARGDRRRIGEATDIYSLGAILYHCLTGRPPFGGRALADIIHAVIYRDPRPPRRTHPRTPRDLEVICLKALEKIPDRRYATARALGEDLDRLEAGKPIIARKPSLAYRSLRYWQRHRRQILAGAALLTVLVLVLVLVLWRSREAVHELSEQADVESFLLQATHAFEEKRFSEAVLLAAHAVELRDTPRARGLWYAARERSRSSSCFRSFEHAGVERSSFMPVATDGRLVAYRDSNPTRIELIDSRSGEVVRWLEGGTAAMAFDPTGTRFAYAWWTGYRHKVSVWDTDTGEKTAEFECERGLMSRQPFTSNRNPLALDRNGRAALFVNDRLFVWEAIGADPRSLQVEMGRSVVAPDWERFAIATDHDVGVFDLESGERQHRLEFDRGVAVDLQFSTDGSMLAVGFDDGNTRVWDLASGLLLPGPQKQARPVLNVAFRPDGDWLATGTADGAVRIWNLARDGEKICELTTHFFRAGYWERIAFSRDGRHLVLASPESFQRWDLTTLRRARDVGSRFPEIADALLGPDAALTLVSVREDDAGTKTRTVRSFELEEGRALSVARDVRGAVGIAPAFLAVTEPRGDGDGELVRVIDRSRSEKGPPIDPRRGLGEDAHELKVGNIALEPSGKVLAAEYAFVSRPGNWDDPQVWILVWDLARWREVVRIPVGRRAEWSSTLRRNLAVAPGGGWIGGAVNGIGVRVWELPSGMPVELERPHGEAETPTPSRNCIAFSPQRSLAAAPGMSAVVVWDLRAGTIIWEADLEPRFRESDGISFSADGRWLAATFGTELGAGDRRLLIWDTSAWSEQVELPLSALPIRLIRYPLSFASEGNGLAVLDGDEMWLVDMKRLLEPAEGLVVRMQREIGVFFDGERVLPREMKTRAQRS